VTSSIVFSAACFAVLPLFRTPVPGTSSIYVGCAIAMALCFLAFLGAYVPKSARRTFGEKIAQARLPKLGALPVVGIFLLFVATGAVWAFADNLGVINGISAANIAVALSLSAITGAIGPVAVTVLGRSPDVRLLIAAGFLGTGAALFFTCVPVVHFAYLAALIAQSIGQMAMSTLVFDLCFRTDSTGRLSTLTACALTLGCAIGPALGGALIGLGAMTLGLASLSIAAIAWLLVDRFETRLRNQWVSGSTEPALTPNL
jgi:predicted MFS family arabinose efflux permease